MTRYRLAVGMGTACRILKESLGGLIWNSVQEWLLFLDVKPGSLPMKYPGLAVGPNSRLLTTWKPALDKTKNDVILGKQNYLIEYNLMEYLGLPVGANYLMEYNLKDVILGKQNVRFVCIYIYIYSDYAR